MSWEMLPTEIVVYIFKIRNEIRIKASKTIQIAWLKYTLPEVMAIDNALNIEVDELEEVMVSIPSTHIILKNCLNMVKGKRNLNFWKIIAEKLQLSLFIYNYEDNNNPDNHEYNDSWLTPEQINYNKTKYQYNKLLEKFKFNLDSECNFE